MKDEENADLKAQNKKTFNDWTEACNKYREVNLKLTRAKGIIENLLGLLPDEVLHHDYYKREYVEPAEQFLKEVTK